MTTRKKVDVAIIGAGSAGMRTYSEVIKTTNSVVLIEGDQYGTTCAKVGCMPSKLLVAAAEIVQCHKKSELFGIKHPNPTVVDGKAVMRRVRSERDRFVGFVKETINNWPHEHLIKGYAKFKSDHVLQVKNIEIEAKRIVIATGSRSNIIKPLEKLGKLLVTNDDIFNWPDLPNSLAVIGAGVIGLELGQALSNLGVDVTIFGRDNRAGPLTDPEVIKSGLKIFTNNYKFYPNAEISGTSLNNNQVVIKYSHNKKQITKQFDYVLAATGRVPNVDNIGLENTSLPLDKKGMPIFNLYNGQIGNSHVFIAGDANNRLPLLHEAIDEGSIAGYNAAHYPNMRTFKKSSPLAIVFSHPQMMIVGSTYQQLMQANVNFKIGEINWSDQGRSRVMLVNQGLLRVYGECNTGKFLGAEMIGPSAEHIAHLLAWAHQSNLTVEEMLERPFYHPVIEEGVRTALRNLRYNLQMGPEVPVRCIDCGPGA